MTAAGRRAARNWDVALAIAVGGALGGGLRELATRLGPARPAAFPWSTFLVNVSGCFALGALVIYISEVWRPSRYSRPFLGTGVLGGFTTFSTYAVQTTELLRADQVPVAAAYLAGTALAALIATWAGIELARWSADTTGRRKRRRYS